MITALVVLAGMLITAAGLALVTGFVPAAPRLVDALDRVSSVEPRDFGSASDLGIIENRSQRLGAFVYQHVPLRVSERQRQCLRLQGRTIADFYGDKAALAIAGGTLPGVLSFTLSVVLGLPVYVPLAAAAIGVTFGFFLPDLMLLRETRQARSSAVEALLVFLDLVTLERLANASATQALQSAAQVSDAPLFVQMRGALERARLEQHSPYGELRRMATDLNLPELNDVANVMQLDETGAALSGTLRARIRELRDAHLTSEQMAASAAAEGMTLYMTLPAVIFGAIFMVAALLRIVGT